MADQRRPAGADRRAILIAAAKPGQGGPPPASSTCVDRGHRKLASDGFGARIGLLG